MLHRNLHDAFIEEDSMLVGLITQSDIARIKQSGMKLDKLVGRVMVTQFFSVTPDSTLKSCRDLMLQERIGRLPVVSEGKLVGVIRERELRDYFYMKLEEHSTKLSQILDTLHEAVCVTDPQGTVILWNYSSEQLYNLKRADILGQPIQKFFPNALTLQTLRTGEPMRNVYHAPRDDFHVVLSTEPIFLNGELVGVVSTDRDVTEIAELNKQLEEANSALKYLEDQVKEFTKGSFDTIVGRSENLLRRVRVAGQVARTEATILITGESGTGKEVFARAIHEASGRKGLFVPLNCGAIPAGLFESELFGYVEGAFTGARKSGKLGVFEIANHGTVFLDEIGEMPLHMQAKLLRVLQEREVQRVGSEKSTPVNCRVVSATNRDLKQMVKEGKFREDLYYRLDVVGIDLPPLRERKSDISMLIAAFLKELCDKEGRPMPQINMEVLDLLENYRWEGNVRQLKNTVEYLLVMSHDNMITRDQVPAYILNDVLPSVRRADDTLDLTAIVARVEAEAIEQAMKQSGNSKAKAAKLLNIPRTTLYYKLQQYGINSGDEK